MNGLAMMVLVVVVCTGCATANLAGYGDGGASAGRSDQLYVDNQLTAEVNRALVRAAGVDAMAINVTCRRGVVILSGKQRDANMVARAGQVVEQVAGVVRVDNRLTSGD